MRTVPRNGHVIWGDQRASNRVYTQGGVYDRVYDRGVYDRGVYDRGVYNQRVYEEQRREAERRQAERIAAERREAARIAAERRWEQNRAVRHDRDHDGDRDDRWKGGQRAGNRDDRWQRAANHDDHGRNGHR